MKINLKPIPNEKQLLNDEINATFHSFAAKNLHREQAWKRKREVAKAFLTNETTAPSLLSEAQLRGITGEALARLVLSKPDPIDDRELKRQTFLLAVEKATTIDELSIIREQLRDFINDN